MLGETTLILPASSREVVPGYKGLLAGMSADGEAAVNFVLEMAVGLAHKARWHFSIYSEGGTKVEFCHKLQSFNPHESDLAWLLEHFSFQELLPGEPLCGMLAKQEVVGWPRGLVYVPKSSSSLRREHVELQQCAHLRGNCIFAVGPCVDPNMDDLSAVEDEFDNALRVSVPDIRGRQAGEVLWGDDVLKVTPRKLKRCTTWPCSGGSFECQRLRPPCAQERLAT